MNIFNHFNIGRKAVALAAFLFTTSTFAQKTCMDVEKVTVNENVTTVITASEPIQVVDISTDKVAGANPLENVVTVKPKQGGYKDGDVLAIVTVITERYRVQYSLVYTTHIDEAVSDKEVELIERNAFHNPAISMSTTDMVGYAMKVWNSPAHYRNVSTRKDKLKMRLNNIYVVGDYFFIDFSVENKTNLQFDIDELRVKLQDKKIEKSTNVQTIELRPALVLDRSTSFKKGYRNVIVLKKMTFPNDKVLTLELSEKQISGRTISLDLDYEDVLSADSFNSILLTGK
jgi:conjugative transposon TraN protein